MAKVPLENLPLERAVLGGLLRDTVLFWQLKPKARPELFTLPMHIKILGIAHQLVEDGRDLSIPGIISRLGREENSDFSPEGYLATLIADEAETDTLEDSIADLEQIWARREMARLGGELIRQSTDDNGLDAMGRLEAAKEEMAAMNDPMGASVRHISVIAQGLIDHVSQAAAKEETVGLDVGLKGMQDLTGPLMPGRLYILAGPPGSGKSALAYQAAAHCAIEVPVLIEEIEMEADELVERDLAGRTGIAADRIERAALNEEEIDKLFDAATNLADLKLYIDSSTSPTMASIRAKAMRMQRLKGLGLLVIDHLLYIQRPDRKMGEFEGIRANLQALKKLGKDLGIPIILLTQLKKEFGDGPWQQLRRPSVNDLYGGSAVEQEADVVLFVHREEYLLSRKEPSKDAKDRAEWEMKLDNVRGKAEILIGKRRGGAGFGVRTVYFDGPRVKFSDQPPRNDSRGGPPTMTFEDRQAAMEM